MTTDIYIAGFLQRGIIREGEYFKIFLDETKIISCSFYC